MQLPSDYFEFFGLPRKLALDPSSLQARFYQLSRQWHPDRFAAKSPEEQAQALDATSIVNDGYRVLRNPVKRAEYLLSEEGFPIGEQRSRDVPPELLEEVFELNMSLEEVRNGDEGARVQLAEAKTKFMEMRHTIDQELEQLFARHDASVDESETARQALHEIRGVLNRRRYIENLIREVDQASSAQPARDS